MISVETWKHVIEAHFS